MFIGEFVGGGSDVCCPCGPIVGCGAVNRAELDIPWCSWDLATDYGLYDTDTRRWNNKRPRRPFCPT